MNTSVNVALGKPTNQSSTDKKYYSSKAVDGNRESALKRNSCARTSTSSNQFPWWTVYLGEVYLVKEVAITIRGDCCG